MMITKMYSVFDSKAAIFGVPQGCQNNAVAIRSFTDAVNSQGSPMFRHPEDFSLFYIGEFDDSLGCLIPVDRPHNLVTASSVLTMFDPVSSSKEAVS